VDMIVVATNLFKLKVVAESDFLCNRLDSERDVICQQRLAILDGKDDVVVGAVYIVVSMGEGHASYRIRKPRFPDFP